MGLFIKDCCLWTLRTTGMYPRQGEGTRYCAFCKKPWHWWDDAWYPGAIPPSDEPS